jgi:electron transfer flavoprotein alpha subunit
MSELEINVERCTLCGACVKVCPLGAITLGEDAPEVGAACNLCGACVEACPTDALAIPESDTDETFDRDEWSGIWVMAEVRDGELHRATAELVGAGTRLAEARQASLRVVALGTDLEHLADDMAGWPADEFIMIEDERLADRSAGSWAAALDRLVKAEKPETILAPATALWREVLPRAAILLNTGLTADCTGLDICPKTGDLLQTRPAFGGDVMATITCPRSRPEMATVRPGVMQQPTLDGREMPAVRRVSPPDDAFTDGMELLAVEHDEDESVNIADADILVAGGRGLGGPEGFELLRQAAEELGGEVAASRPPVDAGWISYPRQVGQTGTTVQPDLYIACGISGSVQHRVGMQSSGVIVAVNTDPEAPIFQLADYGIVGDYRDVLPELVKELKKRKQ